ncbi:MAG: MarR family winged helix-turn-helix transcriptional regulator [Mycobacteriaceae bacterium]|uniref:MarR family winged helix-turn-helix transcriptional regulator n=1 Tax=Corynebacterium sp. TaxID=1720 RepID=UPI003F97D94A
MESVSHFSELADTVVRAARRIQVLDMPDGVVELSNLETIVMNRIDDEPGVSPKRLGRELGLKSSNTSIALKGLQAKGLVDRRPDPADGRGTCVHPTGFAAENLRRVRGELGRVLGDVLEDVPPQDVTTCLRVLRQVNDGLER